MTNKQAQIGKFSPNRSEQPKYNPNWWRDLPKTHPLHDPTPTRQQRRADDRGVAKMTTPTKTPGNKAPNAPNRHERRKAASIQRKTVRAEMGDKIK